MTNTETFKKFISQAGKLPCEQLDEFFANLDAIKADEIKGKWTGGYFPTGNATEFFLKDFIVFKWHGKNFVNINNVKALVLSFLKMKINVPGGGAVLRELEFRNKISTSMIYNYLPIIDNFRKVDNNTIMGIMEIKGKTGLYFYLQKE